MPVKLGAPLLAWDSLTLEELWEVELPAEGEKSGSGRFKGIVSVLFEYLDMCVDWGRVIIPTVASGDDANSDGKYGDGAEGIGEDKSKQCLRDALEVLVAAAVRSGGSKEVKKEVDKERSGIAMWRIP